MTPTLSERLPSGFQLRDQLDARSAEPLGSASQALDIALPLDSPNPSRAELERAAKARAERARQLNLALEAALPLVERSGYDIQALTVVLRLLVEAEGVGGIRDGLDVLGRMLNEGSSGLVASLADKAARDREKLVRKWGRYLDAVFEQMYSWLARARERDVRGLAGAVAEAAAGWPEALDGIERGLRASALPSGRFEAVGRALRELSQLASPALVGTDAAAEPPGAVVEAGAGAADPVGGRAEGGVPAVVAESARASSSAELRVSERFWELQRRLSAFDVLLANGEFEKAGIVESDLRESLEHFDVAAFFPALFARYFESCAEHATALARHRPEASALRSSALSRLYRTDLERFLGLGSNKVGGS